MNAAAKLLDRLDRAKQTRPGNWIAGCPCCDSKRGRPISIRELDNGRVLLHAFCGCETEAVLGALGLGIGDLFEAPIGHHFAPSHSRIPARDLLAVVDEEVIAASIIASDFLRTNSINEAAVQRLAQAAARIGKARDHAQ